MNIVTGKVIIYAFIVVCTISYTTVSASLLRHNNSPNENDYPMVYTMDVPKDTAHSSTIEEFVTHLDLLSTKVVSQDHDDIVQLHFLVHSKEDYDSISTQAPYAMVEDVEETSSFHRYAQTPHIQDQRADTISGFPCYHNLEGMITFMRELETRAAAIDSLEVQVIDIGDSYEKTVNPTRGHDILALRITGSGVADRGWLTDKGIVFITCGIHAREYSPPELCARWAESLVNGYQQQNTDITSVLDHTEIHMIIESNPDGRVIAESNQAAYHRKNTRPGCSYSIGVDLNRNFPFQWGVGSGSSGSKCSQIYRGTAPASEPEVQAIVNHADRVFPRSQRKDDPSSALTLDDPYPEGSTVGVYYDIHAYTNLIIWPWTYEERTTGNEESIQAAARKLKSFNGYALAGPTQPDFIYAASGTTADYFYGELGALSFGYELGTAFYQDCQTFENSIVPDNIPGFLYTAKISTRPYSLAKGPDVIALTTATNANTLDVTVTVSDSSLSAGPGNHPPSTQSIASISLCADMHPYDTNPGGNDPVVITTPASGFIDNGGTTVTQVVSVPLSTLVSSVREGDEKGGERVLYVWGTDSDGFVGPVTAVSFDAVPTTSPTNAPTMSPTTSLTTSVPTTFPTNSPTGGPTTSPTISPTGTPRPTSTRTFVRFQSRLVLDVCLAVAGDQLTVETCDESEDNQFWLIDNNGFLENKKGRVVNENLKLELKPGMFNDSYVFVYNEFHETLIFAKNFKAIRLKNTGMKLARYLNLGYADSEWKWNILE